MWKWHFNTLFNPESCLQASSQAALKTTTTSTKRIGQLVYCLRSQTKAKTKFMLKMFVSCLQLTVKA